jgi:leucyl-tRNA synthetase
MTRPIVYCPDCASPVGDLEPHEFTLLKFEFDGAYLMAATMRPETVFGVTNIWLNPDVDLARIGVEGEEWIVATEAVPKLQEQEANVVVLGQIPGMDLIGKYCIEPIDKRRVLILPGYFVDPTGATGVVMGVPGHIPRDWIALKDILDNPEDVKFFGITNAMLDDIQPISFIKVPYFGEHPAMEVSRDMGIADLEDTERLDEAAGMIYNEELENGVLKENTGKYAGMKVSQARDTLIEDLEAKGIADRLFEVPEGVVCRCGITCIVKILRD